jgi:rod shape-determining protein MreD
LSCPYKLYFQGEKTQISSFLALIILAGVTLLQTALSPIIRINKVHPDLVLVVVIGWIILRGWREGVVWAFIGGLCLDFLSGAPFGVFTLTMLVVSVVTSLSHGRVFGSSIVLPLSLMFPLSFLFNGLALLIISILGQPVVWNDALVNVLWPVAIFNTVVMLFVFPLLYLLNKFLNPQPLSF